MTTPTTLSNYRKTYQYGNILSTTVVKIDPPPAPKSSRSECEENSGRLPQPIRQKQCLSHCFAVICSPSREQAEAERSTAAVKNDNNICAIVCCFPPSFLAS
jgi:hypothetical protein